MTKDSKWRYLIIMKDRDFLELPIVTLMQYKRLLPHICWLIELKDLTFLDIKHRTHGDFIFIPGRDIQSFSYDGGWKRL